MLNKEWEKFNEFKEYVLNFEKDLINIDELYMLINRVTYQGTGRHFSRPLNAYKASGLRYYRFWIIMLEKRGILHPSGYNQVWTILKNGNQTQNMPKVQFEEV